MIQGESYTVHIGNNLDILPTLPDNSVDSIVTDPPYELGFMGKKWDSSGIAYSVELWRECLRVLKPGGHLLSFGGTRTWHRVAVGIEDAGFEVRDSIAWMYGSGFPKSLDVSKAIDKGTGQTSCRQLQFTKWMRESGLTSSKARDVLFDAGLITEKSNQASHYFAATIGSQPAIATADMFDALRSFLPEVPEEIEKLVAERSGIDWIAYKNRAVIGSKMSGIANKEEKERHTIGASKSVEVDITAPSTPEAQQWEGWGTALKPAFEPIVVARKPLIGTVAENVLTHGTGALNIDGSRIGTGTGEKKIVHYPDIRGDNYQQGKESYAERGTVEREVIDKGRWPANVILDEYSAEVLDEQSGLGKSAKGKVTATNTGNSTWAADDGGNFDVGRTREWEGYGDTGGASRFYYVAKASKRDRNEGLEELPAGQPIGGADKWTETDRRRGEGVTREPSPNIHPTVKPTQLMRYLVKLVTPPGGTVLDPFTGSGSTGKAAILEGFRFIGCELTEDYIPIIEGRLKHAENMAAEAETKKDEALF
jgi:DNA modification methylase